MGPAPEERPDEDARTIVGCRSNHSSHRDPDRTASTAAAAAIEAILGHVLDAAPDSLHTESSPMRRMARRGLLAPSASKAPRNMFRNPLPRMADGSTGDLSRGPAAIRQPWRGITPRRALPCAAPWWGTGGTCCAGAGGGRPAPPCAAPAPTRLRTGIVPPLPRLPACPAGIPIPSSPMRGEYVSFWPRAGDFTPPGEFPWVVLPGVGSCSCRAVSRASCLHRCGEPDTLRLLLLLSSLISSSSYGTLAPSCDASDRMGISSSATSPGPTSPCTPPCTIPAPPHPLGSEPPPSSKS